METQVEYEALPRPIGHRIFILSELCMGEAF